MVRQMKILGIMLLLTAFTAVFVWLVIRYGPELVMCIMAMGFIIFLYSIASTILSRLEQRS